MYKFLSFVLVAFLAFSCSSDLQHLAPVYEVQKLSEVEKVSCPDTYIIYWQWNNLSYKIYEDYESEETLIATSEDEYPILNLTRINGKNNTEKVRFEFNDLVLCLNAFTTIHEDGDCDFQPVPESYNFPTPSTWNTEIIYTAAQAECLYWQCWQEPYNGVDPCRLFSEFNGRFVMTEQPTTGSDF